MTRLQGALICALLLFGTNAFCGDLVVQPQASALSCLKVTTDRKLEYPPDLVARKSEAVIRVQLTFANATDAPHAEVTFAMGDDRFTQLVLEHVRSYRLPCFQSGDSPVVAVQEFQFVPGDGRKVLYGEPRDSDLGGRVVDCLVGADKLPGYPFSNTRPNDQNTVVVDLVFKDGHSAPQVTVLYGDDEPRFVRTVREFVANYRLPCMAEGATPIDATQTFRFSEEGSRRTQLKDATLQGFAAAIADLDQQHVRFDFSTMACPFDIHFELRQPYAANEIGEVDKRDPNRREFVEWLRKVKLRLTPGQLRHVIGDSMTISVPCGVLDLT